ncbi:MAG: NAD(P)/FAD-dependent oxidoreductase [Rickettsiales bacterium]|nr:NAD(P)/FAD-dependent oxidoreductase [Rickettsiales bacterium]
MKHHETDVVVIGAGPIGLFTVFQAGMLKMKCHVVDSLETIGGQCAALYPEKPIYDIPAYPEISGGKLIESLAKQAEPFSPVFHLNQQVVKLAPNTDGGFDVITSKNNLIKSKVVIIAAGCGAFGPNRPPLADIEKYEGNSVFYAVVNPSKFKDKKVVIAGGGDSAVDWAIILADIAKSVSIVHRRNKFRCAPENSDKLHSLHRQGKVFIEAPYQLDSLEGDDVNLKYVNVVDLDGNKKSIEADVLLPFFGLSMDIGPIVEWGLNIEKKHIAVNQSTMETNIKGIYAVGDIATYSGKLKLILTGFSEVAMACHSAYDIIYPDTPLHFEYSTTKGVKS